MKNSRLYVTLSFLFLFIVAFMMPHLTSAETNQLIYDDANLLSEKEINKLEDLAAKNSSKRETDFIIVTLDGESGIDIEQYMADFYDEKGFGYDKTHGNAVMLGIDLKNRDVMLMGFYKAKERLDGNRLSKIREHITPDLSDGNYYSAFQKYLSLAEKYIQYRPGVNPDNIFYKTWAQLLFALGSSVVIIWLLVRNVNPKITINAQTYRDDSKTRIIRKQDHYIRTSLTKRRKPQDSNKSGGGGSSGGRTGGGHSYSSSRGKF